MNYLLNNTSAQDLDVTIRCANSNGHDFDLERLKATLADERQSTGARTTIIKLLEREIKRQEKSQSIERECCGTFFRTPHRATCPKYRGKKPA